MDQWRDRQDQPVAFGRIPLKEGELLPAGALDGVPPDKQRLTEATGNEGASFERSYHRAAVVIWLRVLSAEVLLQAGPGAALPLLKQQLTPEEGRVVTPEVRQAAADLARRLRATWPKPVELPYRPTEEQSGWRLVMLEQLVRLGDVGLIAGFLTDIVQPKFDGRENRALIEATRLLGPEKTGFLLVSLMTQHAVHWPGACIKLLKALADDQDAKPTLAWSKTLARWRRRCSAAWRRPARNRQDRRGWLGKKPGPAPYSTPPAWRPCFQQFSFWPQVAPRTGQGRDTPNVFGRQFAGFGVPP